MKSKYCLIACLLATLLCTACGGTPTDAEDVREPITTPPVEEQDTAPAEVDFTSAGVSATFSWDNLYIQVSNVCDIRGEEGTDENGNPMGYHKVFVCYPGAKAVVVSASGAASSGNDSQYEFVPMTDGGNIPITDGMNDSGVDVTNMKGVTLLESGQYILLFETANAPIESSGVPYDVNGDGVIQAWEFPVPTGEAFGLEGEDAVLYAAAAKAQADILVSRVDGSDTMLMLTTLDILGEYDGENGEKNYVCRWGAQYFYDLGEGLSDLQNSMNSSHGSSWGGLARITLAADGKLLDVQETYDGADNTKRIEELCGPLTEIADAINAGQVLDSRSLVPAGDELLRQYLNYYFVERASYSGMDQINAEGESLFQMSTADIESLGLQNGTTGEEKQITETAGIQDVVEHLNAFRFDKTESVRSSGWTYGITLCTMDGQEQKIILTPVSVSIDGLIYRSVDNAEYFPKEWLDTLYQWD